MSGVKGRSGRPRKYEEGYSRKLGSIAARWLADKWESLDDKTKLKIAVQFALKEIPTNQNIVSEVSGVVTHQQAEEVTRIAREEIGRIGMMKEEVVDARFE